MEQRTRAGIGDVNPSTMRLAERILKHLDDIGKTLPNHPETGYPVVWGMGSSSEHATANALDFMVPNDPEIGRAIVDYVWRNRDEFGLIHWIYRRQIRSTRVAPGVVRPHGKDSWGPTQNHMDHPHILFDGTYMGGSNDDTNESGKTHVWYPDFPLPGGHWFGVESANPRNHSGYWPRDREHIRTLQRRFRNRNWVIAVDGDYGPKTESVVTRFQREKGLTVDGLTGAVTWRAAWTERITP